MKKIELTQMFHTGICESTVSKRTIISLISGLKRIIHDPIHCVTHGHISSTCFTEVINQEGCIFLSGFTPIGKSLFDLYLDYFPENYRSALTERCISAIVAVIKAAELLYRKIGFYPPFQLNSVYINREENSVIFLPHRIIDFLNLYKQDEEKKVLSVCSEGISGTEPLKEKDFALCIARTLYLFFSKNQPVDGAGIFDITSFIPDAPRSISDNLWDILHRRNAELQDLLAVLESPIDTTISHPSSKIPFNRRKPFLVFKYSFSRFLAKRKIQILILLLVAGVLFYLVSDYFRHRVEIDYTLGLQPMQVVELYFQAVDELDIDVLEAVLYGRAGREIRNEVSRIYVMTKLEQSFARRIDEGQESDPGSGLIHESPLDAYRIENLDILQMTNGELPVFKARYKKILITPESTSVYSYREMIYLKQYKDHWYIIKIERELINVE